MYFGLSTVTNESVKSMSWEVARTEWAGREEIYATLYPENIGPLTRILGDGSHRLDICDTGKAGPVAV
jgi:hypothetical protein